MKDKNPTQKKASKPSNPQPRSEYAQSYLDGMMKAGAKAAKEYRDLVKGKNRSHKKV